MPLTASIMSWAADLGLSNVGFATPNMADAAHRHGQWIAAGHHGEMAYLARRAEDRQNPALLLPSLKSAIVVSQHYAGPNTSGDPFAEMADPSRAYIARYARGAKDYHDVFKQKLITLAEQIRAAQPGFECRPYVDTGPILEKNLAAQAGIGWQGKHTNLIDPKGGNWFFLGTLLTNLDLPASAPVPDRCGSCTDCLDICPTDAFIGPYQLDARRCISYLTIELKGPIPKNFRPLIGNRVFGCDDCLAVCPWNRFAAEAHEAAYQARPITDGPALIELMSLSREAFTKQFKRTPLFRSKRRGLLRNVAVALGNWGDAQAVPVLIRSLSDDEALIRGHAAWALGRIGGEDARLALTNTQKTELDEWVRGEIKDALNKE